MRFLVDQQLPPALALWLTGEGYPADHVSWRGLARASDDAIWREAIRIGAAIVSKDDDFARRRMSEFDGPPVLWVRLGNVRKPTLLQAFARALPGIVEMLDSGETLVELV